MIVIGLMLLVLGSLIGVSEAHRPTHGIAGGGGVALMAVGLALLVAGLGAGVAIGVGAGVVLAAAGGGAVAYVVGQSGAVRRRRVRGGAEGLIGQVGVVRSWETETGSVTLQGGVWDARRSAAPEPSPLDDEELAAPLHAGDRVVVERLSGLTLSVRRAEEWELL